MKPDCFTLAEEFESAKPATRDLAIRAITAEIFAYLIAKDAEWYCAANAEVAQFGTQYRSTSRCVITARLL